MAFGIPGLGFKSKLLLAHEATYNTAPAAAEAAVELVSGSIKPVLSVITDPSLSATQVSPRFIGQGGQSLEATFRIRVGFEGLLSILRMFFPTYSSALVETGVRDHTFKEGLVGPGVANTSWCLDFVWGDITTGTVVRLLGCYGKSLRISGQASNGDGGMLMADITVVGRTLTPGATPMTTFALPTALGVIYHEALRTTGNLSDGSGNAADTISIRSMDFGIDKPFDVNRFLFGQVNGEAPVPNGFLDASIGFEEEWTDLALMNAAKGATMTALKALFQHPTTIGSTSKREFEIIATSPMAAEYSTELPGFGVMTQKASYKLQYNTTDSSCAKIRVRSTEVAMAF